jgi:hypothetical protein
MTWFERTFDAGAPRLTRAGREWAKAHASTSIVARVALGGKAGGWPPGHIAGAIRACNTKAGR